MTIQYIAMVFIKINQASGECEAAPYIGEPWPHNSDGAPSVSSV